MAVILNFSCESSNICKNSNNEYGIITATVITISVITSTVTATSSFTFTTTATSATTTTTTTSTNSVQFNLVDFDYL